MAIADENVAKILIVEDEKTTGLLLERLLKNQNHDIVGITDSGESAIKMAEKLKPDLLLMDISLEGEMDGIDTAKIIFDKLNIPFIYITGNMDEEILCRAKKTIPLGYILKPFNADIIQTSIEMALYKYKIEKKLKESEERTKEILSMIPDVIFYLDNKGDFINEIDKIMAKKVWMASLKSKILPYISRVLKSSTSEIFEYGLVKGNSKKFYEAIIVKASNKLVLFTVRDITQRKIAENELKSYEKNLEKKILERTKELEELNSNLSEEVSLRETMENNLHVFRYSINQSPSLIVFINKDGYIEYVNKKFTDVTGYQEEDVVGKNLLEHGNFVFPEPEYWGEIVKTGEWSGELYNISKSGSLYYVLAVISTIHDDAGEILHYVIISEDITEKKIEEKEIEKIEKVLSDQSLKAKDNELDWLDWKDKMLTRNISRTDKSLFRNINNSFTQGAGFGSLITLLESISYSSKVHGDKVYADKQLYDLVMDNVKISQKAFKTFSNIDWIISNEFEREKYSIKDLYFFTKGVVAAAVKFASINNHRIIMNDYKYGNAEIFIHMNKDYFFEALYEVILNAMKFGKKNSYIIVLVQVVSKKINISVINDPIPGEENILGIPNEYEKIVFEPFYRLSKNVFENYKSLDFGIGLTLVEKIIQKHGGEVIAENLLDHTDLKREPLIKVNVQLSLPTEIL